MIKVLNAILIILVIGATIAALQYGLTKDLTWINITQGFGMAAFMTGVIRFLVHAIENEWPYHNPDIHNL